ncbi:MAG: DUF5330 domain-containing protein [Afipia sp.]|nr:DUF5330 domain-containing protein [Afipia sp.]OJW66126.1 MAG: hypothetical protein BGO65_03535 [Afipia sp. 64-13]
MFFLLRMAFWLGLVLVLLPTDKTPDADKQPQVDTVEAVTAASAAVSDMAQFCNRQPAACAVGGQAASVIGARAQAGAKKVYHFFTEKTEQAEKAESETPEKTDRADKTAPDAAQAKKVREKRVLDRKNPDHTGSIPDGTDSDAVTADGETQTAQAHDTLTPDDLQIEWQSPSP